MTHRARASMLGILPYAATISVSAFLLFQVQPLITKYILPWFGGGPTIWTTCVLFFQVVLVGGYGYAHLSIGRLRPRLQALLHGFLLLAAFLQLPIIPSDDWKPLSPATPTWDILLLLGATVGVPYFVLSSTAPLMQAWFSQTHPGASPYRLYALSNAGSLLALVSYPFVFEPAFSRSAQSVFWATGFALFAAVSAICIWRVWRRGPLEASTSDAAGSAEAMLARPAAGARALWLALPACGAVLLLAVTNQITMDLVVVPFLWVLPLSLYLVSFILSFEGDRWYSRALFVAAFLPVLLAVLAVLSLAEEASPLAQISVFSAALFVCCMICHGELSRLKPEPRYLTSYYLMIALGGALGGAFVTLIAPLIFFDYLELHFGFLATGALCIVALYGDKSSWFHQRCGAWVVVSLLAGYVIIGTIYVAQAREPLQSAILRTRNFYGVLTLERLYPGSPQEQLLLRHGRIFHGLQFTAPDKRRLATTYYSNRSGAALVLTHFPRRHRRHIGLVGLGAGTLALYARAGDRMRIYEINPEIRRLAESYFTYLKDSPAEITIVMGDGRLAMERDPPQQFDVLLLDAFSGDSIPVHLLTAEAFETYLGHLKPNGVIAILIDTHHLNFETVIRRVAVHLGLEYVRIDAHLESDEDWGSSWIVLARDGEFFRLPDIAGAAGKNAGGYEDVRLWTDDYTSLFPLIQFNEWNELLSTTDATSELPPEPEE